MKTLKQALRLSNFIILLVLLILGLALGDAQVIVKDDYADSNKPETELPPDILWDVKAYLPDSQFLKIKAIDKDGQMYPVKAIQSFDDTSIINIKAIVNGAYLPVKLIVKDNDFYFPLKAITYDGTLLDVKAVSEDGTLLPVKGVGVNGIIVHVRAIAKDNTFHKVLAIAPEGQVNDVKGVKMLTNPVETTINGVLIFAHVKALRQN